MTRVTQAEFARMAGVNRSTVTRWLQNHRITTDAQGLIDPVEAQRMREATASPLPHHEARRAQFEALHAADPAHGLNPNTPDVDATPPATGATQGQNGPQARFSGADGGQGMPQAEKLGMALKLETYKLQKSRAETAAVELDKLVGILVERSEVDYVLADFGNTLRSLLENLPNRLSGPLAALRGDTPAIHTALDEALRDVLHDMAAHLKRKMEGLTT